MNTAYFDFYGELNDFLPKKSRSTTYVYKFDWRASVKDMIEAIAPPHCEVEALRCNKQAITFDYIVGQDDQIEVFDYTHVNSIDSNVIRLKPRYKGKPKFVLDTHLGRLASYLRMMGFDTLYRNDYPDDELAEVSSAEERILLTRDLGLLKRNLVIYGRFVRETNPREQIIEIASRYNLGSYIQPFLHCSKCNGIVMVADQDAVKEHLTERTLTYYSEFYQCQSCSQIYWKGSQYKRMLTFIEQIASSTQ